MDEMSGIEGETHLFRNRCLAGKRCHMHAMPLRMILEQHLPRETGIDFMTVDCEGHDTQVLQSNDWKRFRPQVVLAEGHKETAHHVDSVMISAGYRFVTQLGLTRIFSDSVGWATRLQNHESGH
jgi:hypothetical protein